MYTGAALIDIHERTHRSLQKLLDHCDGFTNEQLNTELDGFGYGTIALQLQHVIGAERYWVGVCRGKMLVDEDEADRESIATLRAFRERVAATTTAYLESMSDPGLNTARPMTTWGDKVVELAPAYPVLRTQTHVYNHQGQVAAMARLLGRPVPPGLDFPVR